MVPQGGDNGLPWTCLRFERTTWQRAGRCSVPTLLSNRVAPRRSSGQTMTTMTHQRVHYGVKTHTKGGRDNKDRYHRPIESARIFLSNS